MSSLNRPGSVTLWNASEEVNTMIGVRVDNGTDKINLSVTDDGDDGEDLIVTCGMEIEHALSLISDLVTAVQVAMSNRLG